MSSILKTGVIVGVALAIVNRMGSCNNESDGDLFKEIKDGLLSDPDFMEKIAGKKGTKGDKGDKGERGESFEFEDFTQAELDSIISAASDLVKADRYINRVPTILTPQADSTTLYPGGVYTLKLPTRI